MRLYLASIYNMDFYFNNPAEWDVTHAPYVLESFQYVEPWIMERVAPHVESFIVDSGAYTYMENHDAATGVDWDDYVQDYADFLTEHAHLIDAYFELDIDSVAGLSRVRELRDTLEAETPDTLACIPVWHRSRGQEAYEALVAAYDWVGIGGIVSGEISKSEYPVFNWLCDVAHDHDTAVHAMGYTPLIANLQYPFDTADSATWVSERFGNVFHYDGSTMLQENREYRSDYRQARVYNYLQWTKYTIDKRRDESPIEPPI